MLTLTAEKFASLMKTDKSGLKAYIKKNGKPTDNRRRSASEVSKRNSIIIIF